MLELVRTAPGVKFLITSRERLNLQGETVFRVGGLAYPEDSPSSAALDYSAVQLFLDNVRRLQPDLPLTPEHRG